MARLPPFVACHVCSIVPRYGIGDRIPCVVVRDGAKPLYECREDPAYAKAHNLPLDVDYYFEKQIEQPMVRLIATLVGLRQCASFFQRALTQNQQHMDPSTGLVSSDE